MSSNDAVDGAKVGTIINGIHFSGGSSVKLKLQDGVTVAARGANMVNVQFVNGVFGSRPRGLACGGPLKPYHPRN